MAALDLTDRAAVLVYLIAELPSEDSEVLEALLDASKADDCADTPVTTYRPWWIVAHILQSNPSVAESLTSAAGSNVTYRDPLKAWRAIMRRQYALDQSLCNIPDGFEAVLPGGVGSAKMTRTYV